MHVYIVMSRAMDETLWNFIAAEEIPGVKAGYEQTQGRFQPLYVKLSIGTVFRARLALFC